MALISTKIQAEVIVACTNASGEPDLFYGTVEVTEEQYEEGDHYDMARDMAKEERYEGPFVIFDECSSFWSHLKKAVEEHADRQ